MKLMIEENIRTKSNEVPAAIPVMIKIISCSNLNFWYNSLIGETTPAMPMGKHHFVALPFTPEVQFLINREDCRLKCFLN